ncbi:MAG TPA: DinB family protein [Blastocatellia bacterium]|nr:DinB family protein [Blastocatellia bacterium]
MLRDLLQHKTHANAALLSVIRDHETAAQDLELRKLLHHILVANRFWICLILGLEFVVEEESRLPESLDALIALYRETSTRELEWMSRASESDLAELLETPFIPGLRVSVAQAVMQVCLHSHGHRAQCVVRLRQLGGTPPATDFILWLKETPAPNWP